MSVVWDENRMDSHWLLKLNKGVDLFENEEKLAKHIVKLVSTDRDPNSMKYFLSLSFFCLKGGKDFSNELSKFDFRSTSDLNLAGWNGLFSYRESDKERMLKVLVPASQHENWFVLNDLHKKLIKEDLKNLTEELEKWKNSLN